MTSAGLGDPAIWIAAAAVLAGALVQTGTGIGFGVAVTPVLAVLFPAAIPAVQLLLSLPLAISMIVVDRSLVRLRKTSWVLVGRGLGTVAGALVIRVMSPNLIVVACGIASMVAAGLLLVHWLRVRDNLRNRLLAGLVSGLMSTVTGLGGPPLALLYGGRTDGETRSGLAIVYLFGTSLSLLALLWAGKIEPSALRLGGYLCVPLAVGFLLCRAGLRKMPPTLGRYLVLLILVAGGATLLVRSLG
jgi:uncharacterized protein